MTTLITISSLIIGAILGAWWQHHRDIKNKRILANRIIDLNDLMRAQGRTINGQHEVIESLRNEIVIMDDAYLAELSLSESLRFQIQQYNIGKDEIKFTEQE